MYNRSLSAATLFLALFGLSHESYSAAHHPFPRPENAAQNLILVTGAGTIGSHAAILTKEMLPERAHMVSGAMGALTTAIAYTYPFSSTVGAIGGMVYNAFKGPRTPPARRATLTLACAAVVGISTHAYLCLGNNICNA